MKFYQAINSKLLISTVVFLLSLAEYEISQLKLPTLVCIYNGRIGARRSVPWPQIRSAEVRAERRYENGNTTTINWYFLRILLLIFILLMGMWLQEIPTASCGYFE